MQWVFKVGYKKLVSDLTERLKYWSDCQLVDIRPTGFYPAKAGKHFCIIEDGRDYWKVRGSKDWKSTKSSVLELKKYLYVADGKGRYPWDTGYNEDLLPARRRDWFLDYKTLLDSKLIVKDQFDMIYDKSREGIIYIDKDVRSLLSHEEQKTRSASIYSERTGTISAGTYSIGSGLDYDTVTLFEADIAAQLTGDLTGEHNNEETKISTKVTFDTDTSTHLLKLTAQSGDEHNGGAYGNGARINYSGYDEIAFNETTDGQLNNVEVSKLAINCTGTSNDGLRFVNGADNGAWLCNRNLIYGDNVSGDGIYSREYVSEIDIRNNIVYGLGNASYAGIRFETDSGNPIIRIYNNTVVGCNRGICQASASESGAPTKIVKNNLVQGCDTDWADAGAGFGTHAYNISEDATSPDASYQSKDLHTNSIFKDYANNDYRLDSNGDATNLAIVDDGEDLSSTFTDDIQGQTRSTWYIGASEIVAAGGAIIKVVNETLQFSESVSKSLATKKIINETLQLSESTLKLQDTKKVINETLQLSESIQKKGATKKVVNETLQLSENTKKISGITKVINETLQIAESIAKVSGIVKVVNEVLQLSENIFKKGSIKKVVNETLQFSEALSKKGSIKKVVNEVLQLSENVLKKGSIKKVVNETLQLAENIVKKSGIIRIINEVLNISEGIVKALAVAYGWREVIEGDSPITLVVSGTSTITTEVTGNSTITTEITGNSPLN